VHSNIVTYPPGITNNAKTKGGPPGPMFASVQTEPMVSVSGGSTVPLSLYPPGFDLAGLTIVDPVTKESVVASAGDTVQPSASSLRVQPLGLTGGTTVTQYAGFYQVVRDGAHLYGLTNGAVLSGIVKIPVELANASGTLTGVSVTENESPVGNSIQTGPFSSP
jgi:hypothetical protein